MGCFYQYCLCKEARPALTEGDPQRGTEKWELDEMRKQYIEEKGYTVVGMWECEWWILFKPDVSVKDHLRESFPYEIHCNRISYWARENQAHCLVTYSVI